MWAHPGMAATADAIALDVTSTGGSRPFGAAVGHDLEVTGDSILSAEELGFLDSEFGVADHALVSQLCPPR